MRLSKVIEKRDNNRENGSEYFALTLLRNLKEIWKRESCSNDTLQTRSMKINVDNISSFLKAESYIGALHSYSCMRAYTHGTRLISTSTPLKFQRKSELSGELFPTTVLYGTGTLVILKLLRWCSFAFFATLRSLMVDPDTTFILSTNIYQFLFIACTIPSSAC